MYHVEDHTHEDYRANRESVTLRFLDTASVVAHAWVSDGCDVRIFHQSHDAAGMTLVPREEWSRPEGPCRGSAR
jgi:hypothetical protein